MRSCRLFTNFARGITPSHRTIEIAASYLRPERQNVLVSAYRVKAFVDSSQHRIACE